MELTSLQGKCHVAGKKRLASSSGSSRRSKEFNERYMPKDYRLHLNSTEAEYELSKIEADEKKLIKILRTDDSVVALKPFINSFLDAFKTYPEYLQEEKRQQEKRDIVRRHLQDSSKTVEKVIYINKPLTFMEYAEVQIGKLSAVPVVIKFKDCNGKRKKGTTPLQLVKYVLNHIISLSFDACANKIVSFRATKELFRKFRLLEQGNNEVRSDSKSDLIKKACDSYANGKNIVYEEDGQDESALGQ
jgi:hypothetical protein